MVRRVARHVRGQLVGYVALFFALSGTAALALPPFLSGSGNALMNRIEVTPVVVPQDEWDHPQAGAAVLDIPGLGALRPLCPRDTDGSPILAGLFYVNTSTHT